MPEKQYDTKFCHFQFPDPKSRHFDVDVCEESSEATSKTTLSVTKLDQNEFCEKPALAILSWESKGKKEIISKFY